MAAGDAQVCLHHFGVLLLVLKQRGPGGFPSGEGINGGEECIDLRVELNGNLPRIRISRRFPSASHTLLQGLCPLWQRSQRVFFFTPQTLSGLMAITLLHRRQQGRLSAIGALHERIESGVVTPTTMRTGVGPGGFASSSRELGAEESSASCWYFLGATGADCAERLPGGRPR